MKQIIFLTIITLLSISCNKPKNISENKTIKNSTVKEVLLVGTFHYNNPGADVAKTKSFDILSEKSQNELKQISSKVKEYNPTQIFVEWPYNEQKELDSLYQLYKKDNYFTNDSLSNFYLKNEIFQLAFRIAKENNLETVYGIDYKTTFPYGEALNDIEKNKQFELKEKIENSFSKFTIDFDNKIDSGASLKELTYFVNSKKELRNISNNFHNNLFPIAGSLDDFNGVFLTSEWYKRNLYMWSLIQKRTKETDNKIMVLVGASHAAILEEFIGGNKNWAVKEFKDIMEE